MTKDKKPMTVNLENCNEIIAEFEFGKDYWLEDLIVEWEYGEGRYNHAKKLYTESLDSLVSVWEKLELFYEGKKVTIEVMPDEEFVVFVGNESGWKPTIQQAAALATAKAIQELDNGS